MTDETTTAVDERAWDNAQSLATGFSDGYVVIECKSDDDYAFAVEELKVFTARRKALNVKRKLITVIQDAAKKATMDQWKESDAPLERIEDGLRLSIRTYTEAKRIKAEEAQAELDRIAREAAETERLEAAASLEAEGKVEEAEAALEPEAIEQAVQQRQTFVSSAPPKVAGVATTKNWRFRITNEDQIPREYMMPNEKAIGQHARSLKEKASIPGVHIYSEDGVRVTGR